MSVPLQAPGEAVPWLEGLRPYIVRLAEKPSQATTRMRLVREARNDMQVCVVNLL